jgi:MFS-type transporter involved in bile tolerance (Atg22 family)
VLGFSVLWVLEDGPHKAAWLSEADRLCLNAELARDREKYGATEHHNLGDAFKLPMVWVMAGVYIVIQIGVYIVNLWMPLILSNLANTNGAATADASLIARYATVPYLLAAIFTVILGRSSDRWNERRGHLAGCMVLAAVGFAWAARAATVAEALCAMSLAAIGLWSTMGPFWALMTRVVGGAAAAGSVAIITSVGACGGFLGPTLTGWLRDRTHSFAGGLYGVGVLAMGAALLALAAKGQARSTHAVVPPEAVAGFE